MALPSGHLRASISAAKTENPTSVRDEGSVVPPFFAPASRQAPRRVRSVPAHEPARAIPRRSIARLAPRPTGVRPGNSGAMFVLFQRRRLSPHPALFRPQSKTTHPHHRTASWFYMNDIIPTWNCQVNRASLNAPVPVLDSTCLPPPSKLSCIWQIVLTIYGSAGML